MKKTARQAGNRLGLNVLSGPRMLPMCLNSPHTPDSSRNGTVQIVGVKSLMHDRQQGRRKLLELLPSIPFNTTHPPRAPVSLPQTDHLSNVSENNIEDILCFLLKLYTSCLLVYISFLLV